MDSYAIIRSLTIDETAELASVALDHLPIEEVINIAMAWANGADTSELQKLLTRLQAS